MAAVFVVFSVCSKCARGRHWGDAPGTVVSLQAVADDGYHFIDWTGDVTKVGDVNAACTAVLMNADFTLIANFAE